MELHRFSLYGRFERDRIPLKVCRCTRIYLFGKVDNCPKQTNQMKSLTKFKGVILSIAMIVIAAAAPAQLPSYYYAGTEFR